MGYYDKGNVLPEQISLSSFGAMTNVLLPTVSSYQSDIEKLKSVVRKVISYTVFLMFPIMLGLLMVNPPNTNPNPVINPTAKFPITGVAFNLYAYK